ncbi:PH domain-containing protein [Saccharospirillum impatiens]|uniref:PH domain-containing protein n=1 Tax=Saccharospirillum impatiens TaxID=169438 RepID=UPI0003FB2B5C|nr:PH domain-containing protein [Saccharospirillum impatiens]
MTSISTDPIQTEKTVTDPEQGNQPDLASDEYILHTGRRHPAVWVALTALALTGSLVSGWLVLPVAIVAIGQMTYSFSITSRQILERRGLLWRRTRRIPLKHLASIDLVNRDFGLMFQVGKLTVTTHQGDIHSFNWVVQPERLIRLLDHQHAGSDLASESEPVHRVRRLRNSLSHLVQ